MENEAVVKQAWVIIRAHDMILDYKVAKLISRMAKLWHGVKLKPIDVMTWASEQPGTKALN